MSEPAWTPHLLASLSDDEEERAFALWWAIHRRGATFPNSTDEELAPIVVRRKKDLIGVIFTDEWTS